MGVSQNNDAFAQATNLAEKFQQKYSLSLQQMWELVTDGDFKVLFFAINGNNEEQHSYQELIDDVFALRRALAAAQKVVEDVEKVDVQRNFFMYKEIAEEKAKALKGLADARANDEVEKAAWYEARLSEMEDEVLQQVDLRTAVLSVRIAALEKEVADKDEQLSRERQINAILMDELKKNGTSLDLVKQHIVHIERKTDDLRDGIRDTNERLDSVVVGQEDILAGQRETNEHVDGLRRGVVAVGQRQNDYSEQIIGHLGEINTNVVNGFSGLGQPQPLSTTFEGSPAEAAEFVQEIRAEAEAESVDEEDELIAEVHGTVTEVEVEEPAEVETEEVPVDTSMALALIETDKASDGVDPDPMNTFQAIVDKFREDVAAPLTKPEEPAVAAMAVPSKKIPASGNGDDHPDSRAARNLFERLSRNPIWHRDSDAAKAAE